MKNDFSGWNTKVFENCKPSGWKKEVVEKCLLKNLEISGYKQKSSWKF